MPSLARHRDEQPEATPLQAYLIRADVLINELAGRSDLRTLETAGDLTRRIFARYIAAAWAEETFGERPAA
jgi:hypothetical protein